MTTTTTSNVQTAYVEAGGRKLAYRSIGSGTPFILCNRFRGILDTWDPAFIDALAQKFQVIIFDYSGIGLSAGELPIVMAEVAEDVKHLAAALSLKKFIIGGWSYGGMVAQIFSTHYPEMISHTILIGTKPPGQNAHPMEQIFLETSAHPVNDLEDEMILFFEPASALSRRAGAFSHARLAQRVTDLDIPVEEEKWIRYFQGGADYIEDAFNSREKMGRLKTPVLVISGDHDVVFPVENWYVLTRDWQNLYIMVFPQAGHGPQHQYPVLSAGHIINFVNNYAE
ncbi:alpha/beta hydrolase [Chitinophaga niabensis]|uniref:alpha/beta fold hydrolase n=1 Tax=Chitinophaga niabensis TaxID=536979 RepID=UPI0031BB9094